MPAFGADSHGPFLCAPDQVPVVADEFVEYGRRFGAPVFDEPGREGADHLPVRREKHLVQTQLGGFPAFLGPVRHDAGRVVRENQLDSVASIRFEFVLEPAFVAPNEFELCGSFLHGTPF